MKEVTIQEFSRLSKIKDSALHRQIMEIPGTITPEKLFAAAERSGYRIIQERTVPDTEEIEPLSLDELDMVVNLAMVKDGCWSEVERDIRAVREATKGKVLKVIIECCLLTESEKIRLCHIVSGCGCDFIKTSTGFSHGGATRADVALLRANVYPGVKVKAAGGISALQDAEDFVALGADRLGTSRIVKIAMAQGYEPDAISN